MDNADSDVTGRLTVDILPSLKTRPAPLFPRLCLRLPDYCQSYRTVGGGVGGCGEIAAFIVRL